jgi:uncharacterized protein (DUF2141 family)
MKKIVILFFIFLGLIHYGYANVNVNLSIQNVVINGGKIYVGVYFNETSFKNEAQDMVFEFEPTNNVINVVINLPEGEYVIDSYQDTNNNGVCDVGLFWIPKEPVGMTNYNGGIPGNFNRHKIAINNETGVVRINLIKF